MTNSFYLLPCVLNKLHLSLYLCTASGNPSVQFVQSALFSVRPAVISLFYAILMSGYALFSKVLTVYNFRRGYIPY